MKAPGPQNPGANRTKLGNLRRSRYFFLLAFFLAAGFLAAFFLAAMMVYLLHVTSDPMNVFGCAGPNAFIRTGLPPASVVASVMATRSSIALQIVVIPEEAHSCQWGLARWRVGGHRARGRQTVAMSAYA